MRFVLFYHSLVSDWNHPGAHFLRGVATELIMQGHSVRVFEPLDGWSLHNQREQGGDGVVKAFHATYPLLRSSFYDPITLNLDEALGDAQVVIAHEWNDPAFLRRLSDHRASSRGYKLLLHDAPHRAPRKTVARAQMLANFDGALVASDALRHAYDVHQWVPRVWTWREAVDTRVFHRATSDRARSLDLVWIGSWGNGERANDVNEFLIEPVRASGLRARLYGARYPLDVLRTMRAAGIDYAGWIPDFSIPAALTAGRFTLHVPWRLRAEGLPPYSPPLRVLQALACGVPVVSAPWDECSELLTPEVDLLVARSGQQMARHLVALQSDADLATTMAASGYSTVMQLHTCARRVQELLGICRSLGVGERRQRPRQEPLPGITSYEPAAARSHAPAAWN